MNAGFRKLLRKIENGVLTNFTLRDGDNFGTWLKKEVGPAAYAQIHLSGDSTMYLAARISTLDATAR